MSDHLHLHDCRISSPCHLPGFTDAITVCLGLMFSSTWHVHSLQYSDPFVEYKADKTTWV